MAKKFSVAEQIPKAPTLIGLSFALNNLRRALWEQALERKFDSKTRREYWEQFRKEDGVVRCTYCDAAGPRRWDHVIPITAGGATVRGNLVPACGSCDDSKGNLNLEAWLSKANKRQLLPARDVLKAIKEFQDQYKFKIPKVTKSLEIWPLENHELAKRVHILTDELAQITKALKTK